jgi:hypothetical protein
VSSTSRKCRTLRARRSAAHTSTTSHSRRWAAASIWSSAGRFAFAPLILSVYSRTISKPRCSASRRSRAAVSGDFGRNWRRVRRGRLASFCASPWQEVTARRPDLAFTWACCRPIQVAGYQNPYGRHCCRMCSPCSGGRWQPGARLCHRAVPGRRRSRESLPVACRSCRAGSPFLAATGMWWQKTMRTQSWRG